jgi:hypothetical protein
VGLPDFSVKGGVNIGDCGKVHATATGKPHSTKSGLDWATRPLGNDAAGPGSAGAPCVLPRRLLHYAATDDSLVRNLVMSRTCPRVFLLAFLFFLSACGGGPNIEGGSGGGGGNNNNPVTKTIIDGNTLITIDAKSNDLAWDSTHQVFYSAISLESHNYKGTISAINPLTGAISSTVTLSQEPVVLSISDDDQFLYAAIYPPSPTSTDGGYIQRYVLPALTADIQIPLGGRLASPGISASAYYPVDLRVVPGSPHSVALVKGLYLSGLISFAELTTIEIYDDQQARANTIDAYPFSGLSLAWKPDASTLFTADEVSYLYVLAVSASGVTNVTTQITNLGMPYSPLPLAIFFDDGSGYIYTCQGTVVDPVSGQVVITYTPNGGAYDPLNTNFYPDPEQGQVYLIRTMEPTGCVYGQCNTSISTLAKSDGSVLGSITFNAMDYPPVTITRWGNNGLAFTTNSIRLDGIVTDPTAGKIFIVQGPLITQ